jgi:exonuclease SbcD
MRVRKAAEGGGCVMKIAHTADWHYGLGYPGLTPRDRFNDIDSTVNFVVERSIEEGSNLFIVAGDLFKDSRVLVDRAAIEIERVQAKIDKITAYGIPLLICSGTPSHESVSSLELLKKINRNNSLVKIVTTPDVACYDGLNVCVLPGMNRSNIMTRDEYRDMPLRDVHHIISRKITDMAQGLRAQIDNDWPSVLLSHLTYAEADTGFNHLLMGHEPILTPEAAQNFDLVALGHIHKAQKIPGKNIFYAGSPERLSFNEAEHTPGFWLHEIGGDKSVSSRFIETPARKYLTISFSDDAEDEFASSVHELIVGGPDLAAMSRDDVIRDAIVRIHIKADGEQAKQIDRKALEKSFYDSGAYFVQEIKIEVERAERSRDREVSEGLGPMEALTKWCERQEIEDEETCALTDLTQELLKEAI